MIKKLETEMWFWRKMQHMPWTARKTMEEIPREISEQGKLVNIIRKTTVRIYWTHHKKKGRS